MHPKEVLAWLNSNEFKEKYLDTNHPYPPLLNPALLNGEGSFETEGFLDGKGLCESDTSRAENLENSKGEGESLANSSKKAEAVVGSKAEALTNSNSKNEQALTKNSSTNSLKTQASSKDEIQARSNTQAFSKDEIQAALKTQALSKSEPQILSKDKSKYKNPALSYEKIPASLAWQLNLPLPTNYKLIFLTNGASGAGAMIAFLKACDCRVHDKVGREPFLCYVRSYDYLSSHKKDAFVVLSLVVEAIILYPKFCNDFKTQINPDNQKVLKLLSLITKKVPCLYVARDPISRMKTIINHINNLPITPIMKRFNLTSAYEKLFVNCTYFGKVATPSFKGLEQPDDVSFLYTRLLSDSPLNLIKDRISELVCIEFNQLNANNAFDTVCKLANKLKFKKPIDKELFKDRVSFLNGGALTTLPITLYVHEDDLENAHNDEKVLSDTSSLSKEGGFEIIITLKNYLSKEQKDFVNLGKELAQKIIIDEAELLILIAKNELERLKANIKLYEKTKAYLRGYLKAARSYTARIRKSLITEKDILDYMSKNKDKRYFYKRIFDRELNYIKNNFPHFMDKFTAYKHFQRICEKDA